MSDPLFEEVIKVGIEVDQGEIKKELDQIKRLLEKTLTGFKFKGGFLSAKGAKAATEQLVSVISKDLMQGVRRAGREAGREMIREMYRAGNLTAQQARLVLGKNFARNIRAVSMDTAKEPSMDAALRQQLNSIKARRSIRAVSMDHSDPSMDAAVSAQARNIARQRIAENKRVTAGWYEEAKRLDALRKKEQKDWEAGLKRRIALQDRLNREANKELAIRNRATTANVSRINTRGLARGMRVGAGAAVALGQYRVGGAMYGLANAANMLGDIEVKSVAARTALFGVGAAFAGLGGVALSLTPQLLLMKSALELDKELMNVSTLAYGVVEPLDNVRAGMRQLSEEAVRLSAIYSRDLGDTLEAMRTALSAGVEMPELSNFVGAAGQLAAGLGTDMNKAIDILTTFRDAYGLTAEELKTVNDKLFNVIDVGKVNISELITSLGRVIPVAKTAGASISDVFTAIAGLTRRGFKANVASTSLAKMFEDIIRPPTVARRAAERYGVSDMFGAGGIARAGGLRNFVNTMRERVGSSGVSEIFRESRGLRSITGLMQVNDLLEDLEKSINQVGSAAKAAERAQANYLDTMKKITTLVSGELQNIGLDILNDIFGTPNLDVNDIDRVRLSIKSMGETFREFVNNFEMVAMPAVLSFFGPTGALVGAILGAIWSLTDTISNPDKVREQILARRERERQSIESIPDPRARAEARFNWLGTLPGMTFGADLIYGNYGTSAAARQLIDSRRVGSDSSIVALTERDLRVLKELYIQEEVLRSKGTDGVRAWVSVTESIANRLNSSKEDLTRALAGYTNAAEEARNDLEKFNTERAEGRFKETAFDYQVTALEELDNSIKELTLELSIAKGEAAISPTGTFYTQSMKDIGESNANFQAALTSGVPVADVQQSLRDLLFVLSMTGVQLTDELETVRKSLYSVANSSLRGQNTRNAFVQAASESGGLTELVNYVSGQLAASLQNAVENDDVVMAIAEGIDDLNARRTGMLNAPGESRASIGRRRELFNLRRERETLTGTEAFARYSGFQGSAMRDMERGIKLDSDDIFNAAKSNYEAYQEVIDEINETINTGVDDFTDAVKDAYEEDAKAYNDAVDEKLKAIKDLQDEIDKLDSDFAKSMREMDSRRIGLAEKYLTERQQRSIISGERENTRTKFNNALATGDFGAAREYASQFGDLSTRSVELSGKTGRRAYNEAMKSLEEETRMLEQVFAQERKTMEESRDQVFRDMTNIVTPSVEAAMERIITAWNDKELTATIQNAAVNVNITLPGATIVDQIDPAELANRVTAEIGRIKLAEKRGVDVDPSTSNNRLNRTPSNNKFSTAKQR